jgi:hypothetical protein
MSKLQNSELEEILDKVSLNSSKGLTKVGLKQAINLYVAKEKIDVLARIRNSLPHRFDEALRMIDASIEELEYLLKEST